MSKCGEEKPTCEAPPAKEPSCEAPKASCDIPTITFVCPAPSYQEEKPVEAAAACEEPKPADDAVCVCEDIKPACEEPPKPACEAPPKPACEDIKPACEVNANKGKDDAAKQGNDNSCQARPLKMDK